MSTSNLKDTLHQYQEAGAASTSYAPPPAPQEAPHKGSLTPAEFNPHKFAVVHPISADSFYERMMNGLGHFFGCFGQIPGCFCCPNPFKEVDQGRIGLVSRFGRYYKTADPGLVYINPMSESIRSIDTKIQIQPIVQLPIVTKDNVSVGIEAVLYWHITDPYLATYGVSNVSQALVERTQTTLRAVLGGRDLQDLIENRNTIASGITDIIDRPARDWGVSVESILIKDVSLSRELQDSLSSAATQKRIGEAKVIQAKAEVDAAMLMREAAEILNTPAAMQIRTLDSLVMMAKTANTKVMFVPVNQDYSNGSINAFGGAGSTVGINMDPSSSPAAGKGKDVDAKDNRYLSPDSTGSGGLPGYTGAIPLHSSVKDAATFAQITEM
ncbi:hypothetical protein IW140_002114 [Coemansia sp. RSA 1813]|nr:hypothetical protein EV178_001262 [Coemansia sp. RSA 1646]KAJ1772615.1 hypothetical protein LPJ74_001331 [Coemansia sp. RSA 1843]KAJ2091471.1 hypothetical protein IW138_001930 [Coemansia sp. RSA 986]KAJ2213867.1 hypothetical protein EV179_003451 [Coemansia sp. RSA 487]KAJ2570688.1 hypothetical protein IW140_002114 [Coemansia sp. RSA 1813]